MTRFAVIAAALLLLAACSTPSPVIHREILRCPPEAVTEPVCVAPPPTGTVRSQTEIFTNELACHKQAEAWWRAWEACEQ